MHSPPFDLQAYQPPVSLWKLVEQFVPEHEHEEIKNMLGESVIDQSLELHEEINTLLDIWRDYRAETTHTKPATKLPEPPGVRDRLVQEIQFFVDNVKEKASSWGVNPAKILLRHNTGVLDYALDSQRGQDSMRLSSRLTAQGEDGRETPMMFSSSCTDRSSEASILSEEVESMNGKLTVLKFDEVIMHLRDTLEEEIETLLKDIHFLQSCLDEEATFRDQSRYLLKTEPTLSDLREVRSSLEKEMLSKMVPKTSPELKKAVFTSYTVMKNLGPSIAHGGEVKTLSGITGKQSLSSTPSGPLEGFTSSESLTAGGAKLLVPIKLNSLKKEKICSTSTIYSHQNNDGQQIDKKITSIASSSLSQHTDTSSARTYEDSMIGTNTTKHSSVNHEDKVIGNTTKHSPVKHEDKVIDLTTKHLPGHERATLEAVVTLYKKGKNGDAMDVQLIPSPPSSAKPVTPRPGSAQRFRRMVLGCRDST